MGVGFSNPLIESHGDRLVVRFVASRDVIHDVGALARYVGEAFEELTATATSAAHR